MTDAQQAALAAYVQRLQVAMHLGQWEVMVQTRPAKKGLLARVDSTAGRYCASLWVARKFWSKSADEQRHTLTHELLHLVHVHVTDTVRTGKYINDLPQIMYDHLYDEVRRQIEYMVDHLATLLAPSMPLPEWPKGVAA